jgi:flagellar export protein FliJ
MKRYRFTMESALRARRAQEEVARQRVAAANGRLRDAWACHAAALAAYRSAMTADAPPTDRDTFRAGRDHEMRLAEAVERRHRFAVEAEVEAATVYSTWVDAAQRVASLERLDDRRRAEWQLEAQRDEATAVDDVVASRWSRATSSDGGLL